MCIFMSRTTNTCFIRDVVLYLVLLLLQNFSFDIYIYVMGIDEDEEEMDMKCANNCFLHMS